MSALNDKLSLIVPLITALYNGERLQYSHVYGWKDLALDNEEADEADEVLKTIVTSPKRFRIRPTYKRIPWTYNDVPMPVCWIRQKDGPNYGMIVGILPHGVGVVSRPINDKPSVEVSWTELAETCEYSTDGKTWNSCSKEVVEESESK